VDSAASDFQNRARPPPFEIESVLLPRQRLKIGAAVVDAKG
jgi:hypothetical protein